MQTLPAVTSAAPPPLDYSAVLYQAFLSGRSAHTRNAYAMDAADFAAFLNLPTASSALAHICALNHGEANGLMLRYRDCLQAKGLATATINRRLSAIRSAAKLARTLGASTWQPEIDGLKVQPYRDTLGPGLDGTRSMLAAARQQNAAKAARDVALIRLMFDLGLRRGEVAALDLADVDASGRRLWIMGKGRTQKESRTLPEPTLVALHDWLAARAGVVAGDVTAIFVGLSGPEHGQRITGRGLYHVIASLGRSVGIKTRPHGLRHASITAALDANNGDVRAVQQHARHSKPETTMRYDDNRKDLAGLIAKSIATSI